MRAWLYWGGVAVVFGAVNWIVVQKEGILRSGETVLLALRPVDPRSLMQGDYMALRYAIDSALPENMLPAADGRIVVRLDANGVAFFVRVHAGEPLSPAERLLRYRWRGQLRLGAESFFFQEGHAEAYARARYGELKASADGDSVLVGLRDESLRPIEPPRPPPR